MSNSAMYDRSANVNILDLGDLVNRNGNMQHVRHKFEVNVYKHVSNSSVLGIVTNSFIRKHETQFIGDNVDEVEKNCHDLAEKIWSHEIAQFNLKKNQKELTSAEISDNNTDNNEGRGSHLIGLKWIGNPISKERIRVPENQLNDYINKGWIRIGPRSKL